MGGGLLSAFLVETAIITYRDVAGSSAAQQGHTINGLPLPADYLAAVIIFGGLGFLPAGGQTVAALFGWGIVTATLLNFWTPSNPTSLGSGSKAPTQGAAV